MSIKKASISRTHQGYRMHGGKVPLIATTEVYGSFTIGAPLSSEEISPECIEKAD
jgi:hypothetical protein